MSKRQVEIAFSDARGSIADIVSHENYDALTIITSKKGAIRGNHYHNETVQTTYLISGQLRALSRIPGQSVKEDILNPGDMITNIEKEEHALEALEDSTFLIITRGPRNGADYESATYRLKTPLQDQI